MLLYKPKSLIAILYAVILYAGNISDVLSCRTEFLVRYGAPEQFVHFSGGGQVREVLTFERDQ